MTYDEALELQRAKKEGRPPRFFKSLPPLFGIACFGSSLVQNPTFFLFDPKQGGYIPCGELKEDLLHGDRRSATLALIPLEFMPKEMAHND